MFANFIKKVKQKVTLDKKAKVYHYSEPNYPEIIDYLIENSITAKTSAVMLSNYIVGKGFADNTLSISDDLTILDFTRKVADSVAKFRGVYVLLKFDLVTEKYTGFEVLPFNDCRLGIKDDTGYNGKIVLSKDWSKSEHAKVDVFNPKVVSHQIKKNGENYKGQIYFLNLDYNRYYPNATIHPVINDCKSEINSSVFKMTALESGFFGKTLVVTKPFTNNTQTGDELYKAQSERDSFRSEMQKFVGADNANGIMHMEMEFDGMEDIEKQIYFKDIQSNINDKTFEYTESSVKGNIMMAFNNIPPELILQSNNIIGNSGESLKQYQLLYQHNTEYVREVVERMINELWVNHINYNGQKLEIIPLIENIKTV